MMKAGIAVSSAAESILPTCSRIRNPTVMKAGAVAAAGTIAMIRAANTHAPNNRATNTECSPVRAPSATPAADSMYDVTDSPQPAADRGAHGVDAQDGAQARDASLCVLEPACFGHRRHRSQRVEEIHHDDREQQRHERPLHRSAHLGSEHGVEMRQPNRAARRHRGDAEQHAAPVDTAMPIRIAPGVLFTGRMPMTSTPRSPRGASGACRLPAPSGGTLARVFAPSAARLPGGRCPGGRCPAR